MSHLGLDRIFDFMGGSGDAEDASHLADCELCRGQFELWRSRLSDLRELESNTVTPPEMHNLRVLFRELGPSPVARSWVAQLIRTSEPAAVEALRGGLAATFVAYDAGPYQIVLQVSPSETEGRFDLQGQVSGEGDSLPSGAHVVLTSERGYAARTTVDAFGEFRIAGVPEGPCRVSWRGGDERIDLDDLQVGESDDGNRE